MDSFYHRLGLGSKEGSEVDRSRAHTVLGLVCLIALVVRVAWILAIPDYDGDAYAHFEFAAATVAHPGDVRVHWIWLPGYHFMLAALQLIGVSFRGVRVLNALLQAGAPFVLYRYASVREAPLTSLTAAALWAVSALARCSGHRRSQRCRSRCSSSQRVLRSICAEP